MARTAVRAGVSVRMLPAARFYHDNVIDHFENPRNVGSLDVKKKTVGTGLVGAPACGDVMRLQIEVDDDGVIQNARFKVRICTRRKRRKRRKKGRRGGEGGGGEDDEIETGGRKKKLRWCRKN